MSNSSSTSGCDPNYYSLVENVKYVVQVGYLAPPAALYCRILYVIWIKYRKVYAEHQFFRIYSMDCVVGLLLLLLDIFITRLFVYFPQFCPSASAYFQSNSLFIDIYYPLLNYLHCAQPLIQIFLTTNRAISILDPLNYDNVWSTKFTLVTIFILIAPFLLIWNTIISPKEILFYFGGFFMKSSRIVEWANMSLFLLVIRSVAVAITVLSTGVMFMRMSRMKKRLKSSERALCIGCASNSVCFMIPSLFEALATFSPDYKASWLNYFIQPLAWDVLNVGSPIVMVCSSVQLRRHVFDMKVELTQRNSVQLFSTSNSRNFIL